MRGTQRETVVGDTPWEALLKIDATPETQWSKDHRSFEQLVELRKLSGLPYGEKQVQKWLRHLIALKKVRLDYGLVKGRTGTLVKASRYIFLK